ncbi:MAG: hypothetical protein OEO83_05175 [Alphaproteobacteria bacterium]|nr:hypothetical protein [Alphaproteobacteria bacterium]
MNTAPIDHPETPAAPAGEDKVAHLAEIRGRLDGTNINRETLLATDYLNHFNEVVMLLEMLPDMPECLDDLREWQPKSYPDHFRDSVFSDRDLAIEAYALVPPEYLTPFVQVVENLDCAILGAIGDAVQAIDRSGGEGLSAAVKGAMPGIQSLFDMASAIINGAVVSLDQDEIDRILEA